jgi:hypothetical protein
VPTGLERIAAKAREERKLKFTSLAHHVTEDLVWESVCHIPTNSAPGCDEQTVTEAKETFKTVGAGNAPCDPPARVPTTAGPPGVHTEAR